MSLSYEAKKNEIPSVYVVTTSFYRNYEVVGGEVDVYSDDQSDDITVGVYSTVTTCASAVWDFMSSHEVTDNDGPIAHLCVQLLPIDEARREVHRESYSCDFLACESEQAVRQLVESLRDS